MKKRWISTGFGIAVAAALAAAALITAADAGGRAALSLNANDNFAAFERASATLGAA